MDIYVVIIAGQIKIPGAKSIDGTLTVCQDCLPIVEKQVAKKRQINRSGIYKCGVCEKTYTVMI